MTKSTERSAYLHALGVDQWQPRAAVDIVETPVSQAANATGEQAADQSNVAKATEAAVAPAHEAVAKNPEAPQVSALPAVEEAAKPLVIPLRGQLNDDLAHDALALASVHWKAPPQQNTQLAVLGIDASTSQLASCDFDQDWAVLKKMLAAIGLNIEQCAVGALHWGEPATEQLGVPYALLLVDSGEDKAALIQYWQEKLLTVHGARSVIAPHPRMFSQGTSLKRQAWTSLQMLQQLWTG